MIEITILKESFNRLHGKAAELVPDSGYVRPEENRVMHLGISKKMIED